MEKLIKGLQLIAKYEPDADWDAQHDIIYVGSGDIPAKMTDEEVKEMKALGWHIDSEDGGWAKFS